MPSAVEKTKRRPPEEEDFQSWIVSSNSFSSESAGGGGGGGGGSVCGGGDGDARSQHLCDLCLRTFQSAKALHGHMKVHSSRSWRGMLPPAEESGVSSLTLAREVDFLSPWVSSRRRRFKRIREGEGVGNGGGDVLDGGVVEKKETSTLIFTKEECDLAESLILLSNSEPAPEAATPAAEQEEEEKGFGSPANPTRRKKKKKKDSPAAKGQHGCSICHASFSTGQALGGHMRRHYRPPLLRLPSPSPGFGYPANPLLELSIAPAPLESSSSLVMLEQEARAAMAIEVVSRNVLDVDLNQRPEES